MTDYYLDASAVVKRYVDETGSTWVREITDHLAQNTILLAEITLAEVAAALAALHRAPRGITQEQREPPSAGSCRTVMNTTCFYLWIVLSLSAR